MSLVTRTVSKEPVGSALAKLVLAVGRSKGDLLSARAMADGPDYATQPVVRKVIDGMLTTVSKAGVPAANLATSGWAGNLTSAGLDDVDVIFKGTTAAGQLESLFRPAMFLTTLPIVVDDGTGAGGWRAEGEAGVLNAPTLGSIDPLDPLIFETTEVFTDILMRMGTKVESYITRKLTSGFGLKFDRALLDPSLAASDPFPASLTYGAAVVGPFSPGVITADALDVMLRSIDTGGSGLVWIANRKVFARVRAALALSEPPNRLLSIPCIETAASPAGQLALLDCAEVYYAVSGFSLDWTRQASLDMADSPTSEVTTPTGAALVSLWQTGATAFRLSRRANWAQIRSGCCCYTVL